DDRRGEGIRTRQCETSPATRVKSDRADCATVANGKWKARRRTLGGLKDELYIGPLEPGLCSHEGGGLKDVICQRTASAQSIFDDVAQVAGHGPQRDPVRGRSRHVHMNRTGEMVVQIASYAREMMPHIDTHIL